MLNSAPDVLDARAAPVRRGYERVAARSGLVATMFLGLAAVGGLGPLQTSLPRSLGPAACGWHVTPLPKSVHINRPLDVSQSPQGAAWAVAESLDSHDNYHDVIMHWNGRRWVIVQRPGSSNRVFRVLAISSSNVWFAGQNGTREIFPFIEHWNGKRIAVVRNSIASMSVLALAGVRANSVWLLGFFNESTYLEHWNGRRWLSANAPNLAGYPVQDISAGRKDLWAVGGYAEGSGAVARWSGSHWASDIKRPFSQNNSEMFSVVELGPRNVWAAGNQEIVHYNGKQWKVTPGPQPNSQAWATVPAIAGLPHGPLYAAGATGNGNALMLRWTGKSWVRVTTSLPKGRSSAFDSLSVGGKGEVWVAGRSFKTRSNTYAGFRPLIEHYVPCG